MDSKPVSLLLSSDDEDEETCQLKIVNTISLQGCSGLSFQEDDVENNHKTSDNEETNTIADDSNKTNDLVNGSKNITIKERKKIKPTQVSKLEHKKDYQSKPSHSKHKDSHNVVDAEKIALQENISKTKDLFDTFLRVCQDKETSENMEKVVQRLIKSYDNARQEYLGSVSIQNLLEAETEKVNISTHKPWVNLQLVNDELKHNKKIVNSKYTLGDLEESQDAGAASGGDEPVIECPKRRKHIKVLEKTLRAINLKIQQIEEKEVDWDDEDNSEYIRLDRYRAQFVKIYTKVCSYKGKLPDADRPYLRKVSFAGTSTTKHPHISRAIERYYNKHREFPDFQDIKKLVILANEQENIQMAPGQVHQVAANTFKEFGQMLKRLRQYDDYDVMANYVKHHADPAAENEELQEELNQNALLFRKKEQEVFKKFAEIESHGLQSEGESSIESKPKKKKQKLIIVRERSSKRKTTNLSSSESSDEEEKIEKKQKTTIPKPTLSSSDSEIESKQEGRNSFKIDKHQVEGKGKALIGKKRLVKRGSVKKPSKPKTTLSSDEEAAPKDTKDAFTDYLGLQTKKETLETNIKVESDQDEVTCVQVIKTSPKENFKGSGSLGNSSTLNTTDTFKTSPPASICKDKSKEISGNKSSNLLGDDSDNSCDVEPIAGVETVLKTKLNVEPVKRKRNSLDSNSGCEESETSDEDSGEEEEKKVVISDIELSDSSDGEGHKEELEENKQLLEPIIILSEDLTEDASTKTRKVEASTDPSHNSSDSDDICILSQESTDAKNMAAKRYIGQSVKSGNSSSQRTVSAVNGNVVPIKRLSGPASSTPVKKKLTPVQRMNVPWKRSGHTPGNMQKRIVYRSNNLSSGNRPFPLPQNLNRATKKYTPVITRVCKETLSENIPLIEID